MITLKRFVRIEAAVRAAGFSDSVDWSEAGAAPSSAEGFAEEAIYVICNSGMRVTIALQIFERCVTAIRGGSSAAEVFGHPGKAAAIDNVWLKRHDLFAAYLLADDKLSFCASLPFVGPITKHHLAKNLGADTAKADVHLARLAAAERRTPQQLCQRLAKLTGYRAATVDTILWRACAEGILNSKVYLERGWKASFRGSDELSQP